MGKPGHKLHKERVSKKKIKDQIIFSIPNQALIYT